MKLNEVANMIPQSDKDIAAHAFKQARSFYRFQGKAPKYDDVSKNPHQEGTREHDVWKKAFKASERGFNADATREYRARARNYEDEQTTTSIVDAELGKQLRPVVNFARRQGFSHAHRWLVNKWQEHKNAGVKQ